MKNSDERIQLITDYISSYEKKIKLNNSLGLFNCAKLFELFALEISKLYFGQEFHNLNDESPRFPYVDLLSKDGRIYVQVTTENDIHNKIRNTLTNIKDSSKPFAKDVKELFFIALDNENVDKVVDYSGENKIGNIDFLRKTNLITTKDIGNKAMSDLSFQIELYKLIKKEDSFLQDTPKIKYAIETIKSVGLNKIIDTIGGKYCLDISEHINAINNSSSKNIIVEGKAGSGKSVLCKKLCENERFLFYARAERFSEESSLDDIWHFDLVRALEFLSDEKITFFVDALEYITDTPTKVDLLAELFECCSRYNNVRIIASCRSYDINAFVDLIKNYRIFCHPINDIAQDELLKVAKVFPVIRTALGIENYKKILVVPFYLNLLTGFEDISNINDENEFRELIWKERICLKDPSLSNDITNIVLDRAKLLVVGVKESNYDHEIVEKLISHGVIVRIGDTLRMAYDIFEDICFEHYIDDCFVYSKGNYNQFFEKLNELGECVYRRYQIWIDDKLLSKDNREKFIYQLLFTSKLPQKWQNQTIIGLIKSRHGDLFFDDYGQTIIENGLIDEFIDITNLYGFEINHYFEKKDYTLLKPSGIGREYLISLIWANKLYKNSDINLQPYLKICIDYSTTTSRAKDVSKKASDVLCYFIDTYVEDYLKNEELYDIAYRKIKRPLESIYSFCPLTNEWLKEFFERIKVMYVSPRRREQMVAEDVLDNLFSYSSITFALTNLKYYFSLYEFYFTVSKPKDDYFIHYHIEDEDKNKNWGLNDNAESYEHKMVSLNPINSSPFYFLFYCHLLDGLEWLVGFINRQVNALTNKIQLEKWKFYFFDDDASKEYYGCEVMWLASIAEYQIPIALSDLVYSFKVAFKQVISDASDNHTKIGIANRVKTYICNNANNIIMLGVISEIGQFFSNELPGYALDVASNIDCVLADVHRLVFDTQSPEKAKMDNSMEIKMGIPGLLNKRYLTMNPNTSLRDYFIKTWVYHYDSLSTKCRKIIQQLYAETPNNRKNAIKYLQIQNMDYDNSKKALIDDKTIAIVPSLFGEAKTIVDNQENINKANYDVRLEIEKYNRMLESNTYSLNDLINCFNFFMSLKDKTFTILYSDNIVGILSLIVQRNDLSADLRKQYIEIFIECGRKIIKGDLFIKEVGIFVVLFNQLENDIDHQLKSSIKKLMLDLLLYEGQNSLVYSMVLEAGSFLRNHVAISEIFFNTIMELAKDEMDHQSYNAGLVIKDGKNKDFVYEPNMNPRLRGVDAQIHMFGGNPYKSKEKQIISDYLYAEKHRDNSGEFNLNEYDIAFLSRVFICYLSLENDYHCKIIKQYLLFLIKVRHLDRHYSDIVNYLDIRLFSRFLERRLIFDFRNAELVVGLMFDEIDYSIFENETIEFYCGVFEVLAAHYFDASDNHSKRKMIEKIFKLLDTKVNDIDNPIIKNELSQIMLFGNPRSGSFGNDWSHLKTSYSYEDKAFINSYFSKYGYLHLETMLSSIVRFHAKQLLPDILFSLDYSFKKASEHNHKHFHDIIVERSDLINTILTICLFDYRKSIKVDDDLRKSFISILKILIELRNEQAAVFLDEFLIH